MSVARWLKWAGLLVGTAFGALGALVGWAVVRRVGSREKAGS